MLHDGGRGAMSVAVDLDGTLAYYEKWEGEEKIGKVIPAMKSRIVKLVRAGKDVVIFSARAATPKGKAAIERWLAENGLGELSVTNEKTNDMELFFDDRAVQVERNTGRILSSSKQ